ncbi:hypothetical protein NRIC_03910 [Enterococcus florum]|uniref:HK97 gp10 family phage protein n=1 Tax=Enterococcus florum TaxID=2480627 RepID=A0A4P5P4E7_9ENTE|nr:hypothetical protein [Enterococcus florum]GCF92500.1 hypothetical protein NRIC_03910 [Enterococcus florum]
MALKKIVMRAVEKEIEDYTNKMVDILKQEVHVKSGATRDAITKEKKGKAHFLAGVDVSKLKADPRNIGGVDYSVFYHDGHAAYTIRPRKAKALRWLGKDGKVHFAKSVRIPASAGDPFVARAVARRPNLK